MTTLTIDELLAEIQAAYKGDEGLTGPEWAEKMGVTDLTARKRIKILLRAGRMAPGEGLRTSEMDGKTRRVPVYRIV